MTNSKYSGHTELLLKSENGKNRWNIGYTVYEILVQIDKRFITKFLSQHLYF